MEEMIHLRPFIKVRDRMIWHLIFDAPPRPRIGALCFPSKFPRAHRTWIRLALAELFCVALIFLGTACGSAAVAASAPRQEPSVTVTAGRWEIIALNPQTSLSSKEGWKTTQIDIVLENKTPAYSAPYIKTTGTRLFTDPTRSYAVTAYRTTGAGKASSEEIRFNTKLPPGFLIKGEYDKANAVVAFYFEAEIPKNSEPLFLVIPNYTGIVPVLSNRSPTPTPAAVPLLVPVPTPVFPVRVTSPLIRAAGSQVSIPGKAILTVGKFGRQKGLPSVHDIITSTITLMNTDPTTNTLVSLQFLPLGDDGIVGAPYNDTLDCRPKLNLGPGMPITSTICVIVPHRAKNIHMIFLGDLNECYYDANAPAPAP
jgi:hypothetical protein